MPIYVYRCPSCDHIFEELVRSMSASENIRCPACGEGKTERRQAPFSTTSSTSSGLPCGAPAPM